MKPHNQKIGFLDDHILRCLTSGKFRATEFGEIINTNFRGTGRERIVSQQINPFGYKTCNLQIGTEDRGVFVHRVVIIAFRGLPPSREMECNHINGIKADNRPLNLEWTNRSQNIEHAYRTGLKRSTFANMRGSDHSNSHLTDADVRAIRALYSEGVLQREIGAKFGINQGNVSAIVLRRTWKHISEAAQ